MREASKMPWVFAEGPVKKIWTMTASVMSTTIAWVSWMPVACAMVPVRCLHAVVKISRPMLATALAHLAALSQNCWKFPTHSSICPMSRALRLSFPFMKVGWMRISSPSAFAKLDLTSMVAVPKTTMKFPLPTETPTTSL